MHPPVLTPAPVAPARPILVPLLALSSIFWGTSSASAAQRYKAEGEQRRGTARSLSDPVGAARGRLVASIRSLAVGDEGREWREGRGGRSQRRKQQAASTRMANRAARIK